MAILEWWRAGRDRHNVRAKAPRRPGQDSESDDEGTLAQSMARKARMPPFIAPDTPVPCILASDPVRTRLFACLVSPYS